MTYGVDIEPNLVNYLNLRAHREGLTNLVSLVCTKDDPCIPEPVDLVFVCDTFHHIGDRVEYFGSLKAKLRPGGRLAIVDFKEGDFPVGPRDPQKIAPDSPRLSLFVTGYSKKRATKDWQGQKVLVNLGFGYFSSFVFLCQ